MTKVIRPNKLVRFTETSEIERGNGKPNVVFQAGKEYDLREDRARYWVDRKKAEYIAVRSTPELAIEKLPEIPQDAVVVGLDVAGDVPVISVITESGEANGSTVESAAHVSGQDSGDTGKRVEHVHASRGHGRRGRPSGSSNK